jgi:hypothetical protein
MQVFPSFLAYYRKVAARPVAFAPWSAGCLDPSLLSSWFSGMDEVRKSNDCIRKDEE